MIDSIHLYILVPYRDRTEHLKQFVPAIHKFLGAQPHTIIIVEQTTEKKFNRGKLINIGFTLADDIGGCFALHDVDMLPIEANYYPTPVPTHMATEAEQFGWKLPYPGYFGGVTLFPGYHFKMVNGFGNEYWGWGAEDDDLRERCRLMNIPIGRRKGRFTSLAHENRDQENLGPNRARLNKFVRGQIDFKKDGLSNLEYKVINASDPDDSTMQFTVEI